MLTSLLTTIDWATIALSFFNTIILTWLGLTVLLNTDRHSWGTWIGGGGMLLGGLFFAGHSLVVGQVLPSFSQEMELLWRVGWLPFVGAPYVWYVVMAWYTGVFRLRRHRIWLTVVSILGAIAVALLIFANPLPSYSEVIQRTSAGMFALGTIPVVLLIYPVYSTLCLVLSFSALRFPEESERLMGNIARQRAHPWLVAASAFLLIVTLGIGGTVSWFLYTAHRQSHALTLNEFIFVITLDVIISGLIAVAVLLLGQAVVAYEIFTGKSLPRGGLRRYWRSTQVFAASYSILLAWFLEFEFDLIYILVLMTIMMTLRFALANWRSYVERERSIDSLRPFVTSQRLYDRLMQSDSPSDLDLAVPLRALCDDVLDSEIVYLVALGPFAPLIGSVVAYTASSETSALSSSSLGSLASRFDSPQTICLRLDPADYGGAVWAVPLWSERGLIGALLLGRKRDDGLYTQEEIEIARAAGERLIDTQASAELARRLMTLQRQRLAQSQVMDQRTRRELHDDILPQLHMVMLLLSGIPQNDPTNKAIEQLTVAHRQISNLLHAMPTTSAPEIARLGLVGALRQLIDKELGMAFDGVTWHVESAAEHAANEVTPLRAEVIFYAAREIIRNAARYGRGDDTSRLLHLTMGVALSKGVLVLTIADDGVGFSQQNGNGKPHPSPSPTTAPLSSSASSSATAAPEAGSLGSGGSGQGLVLHTTMMAVIGGTLTVESVEGAGTRVKLSWM